MLQNGKIIRRCASLIYLISTVTNRFSLHISQLRLLLFFQTISDEQLRDLEKQRHEHKLGILLVGISVLFILCQSFKIIPDLYEIMFCSDARETCLTTPFIAFCVSLSHLLVCFNSSANFVIYLLGGEKFRTAWCETYLCRRSVQHERYAKFKFI